LWKKAIANEKIGHKYSIKRLKSGSKIKLKPHKKAVGPSGRKAKIRHT
jgi:hypothetical protein